MEPLTSMFTLSKYWLLDYWHKYGDKRASPYWLAKNGMLNSVIIVLIYLVCSTILGPRLMRNRAPFSLKPLLVLYNLSMAITNLYFLVKWIVVLRYGKDLLDFNAPDPNDRSQMALYAVELSHMYWILKYVDFVDTFFFVLRKKFSHLNFLHLYHHSSAALMGTIVFNLYPTGKPVGIFVLLNTFVHVVMYCYYGLSALGPWIQRYLWWKRYITQLQIVQFMIYVVHQLLFWFLQRGHKSIISILGLSQGPLFLFLFAQFYIKTYNRRRPAKNMNGKNK